MKLIRKLEEIISGIHETNSLLNMLIKKVTLLNTKGSPWLEKSKCAEAEELKNENPEMYGFIVKVIKLFFT